MPRRNTGQEVWKSLDSLTIFRQVSGGGSTTLGAAITAGATAANFTSTASFTAADPIFIVGSSGTELNAIGAAVTPTTAVPLLYPAAMANPSGSQLLEAVGTLLGHIEQGGVAPDLQSPLSPVFSALSHAPITYLRGFGEFMAQFGLLGFNILNWQTALGITEAEGGAGSVADPYRGAIVGGLIGSQGIQCLRATGTLQDGSTVLVDMNNCFLGTRGGVPLTRGAAAVIPVELRFQSYVLRIYS